MPLFSANLGLLWADLALPDAIRAAAAAGFDAVECQWPYDVPAQEVRQALDETGLPMLSLNTPTGETFGLCAIPGGEAAARASIDQAFDYAAQTGTGAVHVMSGMARGPAARETFLRNLDHAAARARADGRRVLIEGLNPWDRPGYHLRDTTEAATVIGELGAAEVRMMFDFYHVSRAEGRALERFDALRPLIGHVQFAGVPDRGPPDRGEVDYAEIFAALDARGWDRPLGAEYRPEGATGDGLGWMTALTVR